MFKTIVIRADQVGLHFVDGEFKRVLSKGRYRFFNVLKDESVEVYSLRDVWFEHADLDVIVASEALAAFVTVLDIKQDDVGLVWVDGRFDVVTEPGLYALFNAFKSVETRVVSRRNVWLEDSKLDAIVASDKLADGVDVLDIQDDERALVWIDGRFEVILDGGLYAYWTGVKNVKVERVSTEAVRFEHRDFNAIANFEVSDYFLDQYKIDEGMVGLLFIDGRFVEKLGPGRYAFWKKTAQVKLYHKDLRERVLDIAGQDIMTADKVSLRLNAVLTYRLADALKAVTEVEDESQALYREAQLALRAVVGGYDLDALLADKDAVAQALQSIVAKQAVKFGVEVISLGIRDLILPGDMKTLLNQVTEAKKKSEAELIVRREEIAAMRSQANTAKMLDNNPALMRMRELEVLEKVAQHAKLNVVLSEKGLTSQLTNLL